MPTNFLVAGDPHWKAVNPRARLDDFKAALAAKFMEIFGLARLHRAAASIIPGDIFDTPGVQLSTIGDLMEILREAPCPVLVVPGNHDLYGANPETFLRTPFGLLVRGGWLQNVSQQPFHMTSADGVPIIVSGHGYDAETDMDPGQYTAPPAEPGTFRIHLSHGMLLRRSPGMPLRHTALEQLEDLPNLPDVLINGHEHHTHWVQRVGKTLVLKPGALARLTAHVEEMHRQVQVMLLTVDRMEARVQDIPLQSARPGTEILSRDHLVEAAEREDNLEAFLALLADQGEMKFLHTQEMAAQLAEEMGLPSAVLIDAKARLTRAREEIGDAA